VRFRNRHKFGTSPTAAKGEVRGGEPASLKRGTWSG
jgi:hypothetical protein